MGLAALMEVEGRAVRAIGRQLGEKIDQAQIAALALQPGDRIRAIAAAAVANDGEARLAHVGESLRSLSGHRGAAIDLTQGEQFHQSGEAARSAN